MAHHLAHENNNYGEFRDVRYTYDELNRLTKVDDSKQDVFDEIFAYDAQGRITAQRRAGNVVNPTGGEYSYYSGKNRLKSVADNMGGTADERNMSDTANFVYDSVGNLTYDKSKGLEILYDWRGMPIEFIQTQQPTGSSSNTLFKLVMRCLLPIFYISTTANCYSCISSKDSLFLEDQSKNYIKTLFN